MIEAVIVFGIVIFAGFALIAVKLKRSTLQWLLGHAAMVDIAVTLLALAIHWGTMTGLMAAAAAGVTCSLCTSLGRRVYGYREGKRLVRGWVR